MNKTETTEVMHLMADTLRNIFAIAGVPIPEQLEPERDALVLADAIRGASLREALSVVGSIPANYPPSILPERG